MRQKRKSTDNLYTVRCLFLHPTRTRDADATLMEERITLWSATSFEDAYKQAEQEAREYARAEGCVFERATDAYHLFETDVTNGAEVWALMRDTRLDVATYIQIFCTTKRDWIAPER